jgi:C-terminal processing protease CtpA/Prc
MRMRSGSRTSRGDAAAWFWAVMLLGAGWLAGAATAAAASDASTMLERLDHADYHVRQHATRELLQDERLSLDDLVEWYARAQTPEQRHRLMNVAQHHVLRRARERDERDGVAAAIGFSHEVVPQGVLPGVESGAVLIVATLPGFPGHAYLQPGDAIVAFNDQPLPVDLSAEGFREVLRRFRPGQTVSLSVIREGERYRAELTLVGMDMLQRLYADELGLRQPYLGEWHAVRDRMRAAGPEQRVLTPR